VSIVVWIVTFVLSAVLAATIGRAGWLKAATPIAELAGSGLVWVTDIPRWSVRLIGVVELAAAVVIVAAPVVRFIIGPAPLVTAAGVAAATGVALLMAVSYLFHRARGETSHTWQTLLAFAALALVTAAAQLVAS
jgi:hypothetical protein